MVYLVRHAHAGRKADWPAPDLERPLSEEGRRQAIGLIAQLRGLPVRRLLSSPAERCLGTVRPLSGRLGVPVEPRDNLGVDASGPDVLALLADPALDQAVLCTHGEVIGKAFEELRVLGIRLSERPRWPKGSTWIIDRDSGSAWKGTYLAPLVVGANAQGRPPR